MAQSPVSINHAYINEEFSILSYLEAAFDKHVSLTLCSIYVSSYFFTLIDFQLIEDLLEVANKRFVEDFYTSELLTSKISYIF